MRGRLLRKLFGKIPDKLVDFILDGLKAGAVGLCLLLAAHWLPKEALTPDHKVTFQSFTSWFWQLLTRDPVRGALVICAIAVAGAILIAAYLLASKIFRAVINAYHRRELVQLVGLSGFWSDSRGPVGEDAWGKLCDHISNHNRILNILGSTGIDTFGRKGTPLWDALNSFDGEIRIILMSPNSKFLLERASDVKMPPTAYRQEIMLAIKQIEDWQASGRRVTYRTYDAPPNWKLILTNKLAWVQYYRHRRHVQETPVYQFYATLGDTGLYHAFDDEFARIWRLCGAEGGRELVPRSKGSKKRRSASPKSSPTENRDEKEEP